MNRDEIEQIIEDMRQHAESHGLLVRAEDLEAWADVLEEILEEVE